MKFNLTFEQQYGLLIDRDSAMEANAGSGKTRVLTERYLDLITKDINGSGPLLPSEIAAITFTNKAASEMRERISSGLDNLITNSKSIVEQTKLEEIRYDLTNAEIFTFHTFYNNILRNYADLIDLPYDFGIISNVDEQSIIDETVEKVLGEIETDHKFKDTLYLFGPKTIQDLFEEYIKFGIRYEGGEYETFKSLLMKSELVKYEDLLVTYEKVKENKYVREGVYPELSSWDSILYPVPENLDDLHNILNVIKSSEEKFLKSKSFKDKFKNIIKNFERLISLNNFKANTKIFDILNSIWDMLIAKKKRIGKISHNDTMILADELFTNNPDVAEIIKHKYKEILIDEFQDTSPDQVKILKPIISLFGEDKEINRLFIVGDPKQSIYGFKGSDVSIFLDFINRISDYNKENKPANTLQTTRGELTNINDLNLGKIPLSVTYRCSPSIIDFTNHIFEGFMVSNEYSGVDYLPMVYGIKEEEHKNNPGSIEILITEEPAKDDKDKYRPQFAEDIANKVHHIINSHEYKTFKGDKYNYGDIAILARDNESLKNISNALSRLNIPNRIDGSKNYFSQREITETIAYLRFLLNSSDDVALAAVLTSYFHGLSKSELAYIKLYSEYRVKKENIDLINDTLFDRLKFFVLNTKDDLADDRITEIYQKAVNAYNLIVKTIPLIHRVPTSEIISMLCRDSNLDFFIGESDNPEKSKKNIEKLIKNAREVQLSDFFDMSKYIDALFLMSVKDEDEEEVDAYGNNVVQIMTIHKSKGLEFPIVIYANKEKSRQSSNTKRKNIITDNSIVVPKYIRKLVENDNQKTIPELINNPIHKHVIDELSLKEIEEEKRLSYVACTRAQERLIIQLSNREKREHSFPWQCIKKYHLDKYIAMLGSNSEDQKDVENQKNEENDLILLNETITFNNNIKSYDSQFKSHQEQPFIDIEYSYPLHIRSSGYYQDWLNSNSSNVIDNSLEVESTNIEISQKDKIISNLSQDIKSKVTNRIFFPTNLILANKSTQDYIKKYVWGFHEADIIDEIIGNKSKKEYFNKITHETIENELTDELPFTSINNNLLPQIAIGSLIHKILEIIHVFIDNDDNSITLNLAKLSDWIESKALNMLKNLSQEDTESLSKALKVNQATIVTLVKELVESGEIPYVHLSDGIKEKLLFKSIDSNSYTDGYDILGGIIDLYYIDEANKTIYVYDWKVLSQQPTEEKIKEYEFQIQSYMYLVRSLDSITAKDYQVQGRLVLLNYNHYHNKKLNAIDSQMNHNILNFVYSGDLQYENKFKKIVRTIDKSYYHNEQIVT